MQIVDTSVLIVSHEKMAENIFVTDTLYAFIIIIQSHAVITAISVIHNPLASEITWGFSMKTKAVSVYYKQETDCLE